ncbi:sensor histidine kinase [Fulvitalea axinellae]
MILTFAFVMITEELLVERLVYPVTRGQSFPGVIHTLAEIAPPIILMVCFKFAWDATRKQHELDELKIAIKESELQFLKNQINPHFLFNNLNNIYSYSLEHSPKTPSIILKLSSVLRYMLYDCREDLVNLESEIEHLRNFTALNELQIENRGEVRFKAKNITSEYRIAPLILTVFVENAFKHSMASQSGDIEININTELNEEGTLNFSCENSFRENPNHAHLNQGIGLENVRKRLALIYPNRHTLRLSKEKEYFRVELELILKLSDS